MRFSLILPILVMITGLFAATSNAATELETRFLTCLQDSDGAELPCLNKLGPAGWMPVDDSMCETVAARIEAIIEAGGLVRDSDLFRNERCARLGRPHHEEAAAVGSPDSTDRSYNDCRKTHPYGPFLPCMDDVGYRKWYPSSEKDCPALVQIFTEYPSQKVESSWKLLFNNERCRRLGQVYFVPLVE